MEEQKYCHRCEGRGQVDTGIDESPTTICNACNGTGLTTTQKPTAKQVDAWYAISAKTTVLKGASDHAHTFAALAFQAGHAAALAELRAGGVELPDWDVLRLGEKPGEGKCWFEASVQDYGDRRAATAEKNLRVNSTPTKSTRRPQESDFFAILRRKLYEP